MGALCLGVSVVNLPFEMNNQRHALENGRSAAGRLLIVWLFLVLVLSVVPTSSFDTGSFPIDKAVHFALCGVTSIMVFRFLRKRAWEKKPAVFLSIGAASLYGLFLEVLQYLIPYRSFSLADAAANALGAALFVVLYSWRQSNRTA